MIVLIILGNDDSDKPGSKPALAATAGFHGNRVPLLQQWRRTQAQQVCKTNSFFK